MSFQGDNRGLSDHSENMAKQDIHERFFSKLSVTNKCWLWKGFTRVDGYGSFSFNGKECRSHRVAFELFKGPIPEGLQIDHLCRVRHCVNPEHLEAVTLKENINRGIRHKKSKIFCNQGHYLSEANVYYMQTRTKTGRHCKLCFEVTRTKRLNKTRMRLMEYYSKKCPVIRWVGKYLK